MFDKTEVLVRGGNGGDGTISFRHEKFVPFGGPDGGDGGKGGDVIIRADPSVTNLQGFKLRGIYRAEDGKRGEGKKKHGKNGKDLMLTVPVGTIVTCSGGSEESFVADLEEEAQEAVVAQGGRGGRGNVHFAASVNQTPHIAQKGEPGEDYSLVLEMRLIADVGIIGYPNAGKSTLLAAASAARPKIASYPFTTLEPVLGVVEVGKNSFTLAEIPGLIEGAHLGRGLGHEFLRHAMRTRVLIHLVDASSRSPGEDMVHVNAELGMYDPALAAKPQVFVLNKIDLPEVQVRLAELVQEFVLIGVEPITISAATGTGVPELMAKVVAILGSVGKGREERKVPQKVFRPRPKGGATVHKEGDTFVVVAPELERLVTTGGMTGDEIRWQLKRRFGRLGVDKALVRAGVKPGDKVRCGNMQWEW